VTNHEPRQKKFLTATSDEDEQFYRYKQSLAQYNSEVVPPRIRPSFGRYERGTLLQRILDPLAGAEKLDNGALFYEV
jgi:hypothetical protein